MNMVRTILPLMVTGILNIIIFMATKLNNGVNNSSSDTRKHKTFVKNKKAAKTISMILVSIILSYVPLRIITIISVCGAVPGLYERISNYIVLLKFLNSITNPTIYMLTTRHFKQSIKNYLGRGRPSLQLVERNTGEEGRTRKISDTGSTLC